MAAGSAGASPPTPPSVPRLAAAARRVTNVGGDGARGTWEAVRGVLEESARLHASWTELAQRIEEAEAILAEGESELAELAEVELGEARTSLVTLAEEARTALVADPEDARRRVIVEIRALGLGGSSSWRMRWISPYPFARSSPASKGVAPTTSS